MHIGLDESGTFGRDVRLCSVEAEEPLDDLVRFYLILAFGEPFPHKPQKTSPHDLVCVRKLLRYIESDSRLDWRIHILTKEDQFNIASRFSAFEATETAQVLTQANDRLAGLDRHIFEGIPANPHRDEYLRMLVGPRQGQEWKSAVGGWWRVGHRWVRNHQKYLTDPRRPDRFTKGLAYAALCHSTTWKDEGPTNWYIDGGNPMVFWRQTLREHNDNRYAHGVVKGDLTHPLITAADRICRAFPQLSEVPHSSSHIAHVDLAAENDRLERLRNDFKKTVITPNFNDLVLVESAALPEEPSHCLVASIAHDDQESFEYPDFLRVNDLSDFLASNAGVESQVVAAVAVDADAASDALPGAEVMSSADAWDRIETELRRLQQQAGESFAPPTEKSRIVGKIQRTIKGWSKRR